MIGRHELTDAAWARIEPLLPATGGRGGRWRDHRQVINAILWQAKTGVPWRDLPERYGPWKTAHERLRSGPPTAPGSGSWPRWWSRTTLSVSWSGPSAWTPARSGRTSTPLAPGKRGLRHRLGRRPRRRRRSPRTLPRRTDHQAASGRRRARTADGRAAHPGPGRRQSAAAAAAR